MLCPRRSLSHVCAFTAVTGGGGSPPVDWGVRWRVGDWSKITRSGWPLVRPSSPPPTPTPPQPATPLASPAGIPPPSLPPPPLFPPSPPPPLQSPPSPAQPPPRPPPPPTPSPFPCPARPLSHSDSSCPCSFPPST